MPPSEQASKQKDDLDWSTLDSTGMIKRTWQPDHGAFTLYERMDGDKKTYWIKLAGCLHFFPDTQGPFRGPCKQLKSGEMLSTGVMDPILEVQRKEWLAVFLPTELVYAVPAGFDSFDINSKLIKIKKFKPKENKIIVRIVHSDIPLHWTLLMHFIPIETVLVWDGLGDASTNTFMDDDEGIEEQDLSAIDSLTLDEHAKWTKGTIAEAKYRGGTRWKRQIGLGHGTQNDSWSCGLWCLARIEDLYSILTRSMSADSEINYENVVGKLIKHCSGKGVGVRDLNRANARLRRADSLGYQIKS